MTSTRTGLWANLCEKCAPPSDHGNCDQDRACHCGCNFIGAGLRDVDRYEAALTAWGATVTWPGGKP